jgi:hypothetical protein
MIIDIDIKISDSDGRILHHEEKQFNKLDDSHKNLNFNIDLGKSFECFLSEYMSYSGRLIRDRLISEDMPYTTADSIENEVEYRIRIGSNHLFTGKFPVNKIAYKNSCDFQVVDEEENWDANQTMLKAIEKYEANFFDNGQINENLVTA